MGRTLPSAAIQLQFEQDRLRPFQRGSSRSDLRLLDELWDYAAIHIAEAAYAAATLPMYCYFTAMLLEHHQQVLAPRNAIDALSSADVGGSSEPSA